MVEPLTLTLLAAGAAAGGGLGALPVIGAFNEETARRRAFRQQLIFENQLLDAIGGDPLLQQLETQALAQTPSQLFDLDALLEAGGEQIGAAAQRQERQGLEQLAQLGIQGQAQEQFVPEVVDLARRGQMDALRQSLEQQQIQSQAQNLLGQLGDLAGATLGRQASIVGALS